MENKQKETKKPVGPELQKGSYLFGSDYIVDSYFKSGGMGTDIYKCHKASEPDKKLAAKIVYQKSVEMTQEGWNRVQAEAKSLRRVFNRPNLIQTYDVLRGPEDNPCICIIMDFVEGLSLKEYLAIQGCLGTKAALTIFLKILKGIQVLHNFKHQIIHRDLKPENIMVSNDLSKVTIIDFGIATVIDKSVEYDKEGNNHRVLNDETSLYGTESYIIPDVLLEYKNPKTNERNITVQADFYSLGIILYEMIIGQKPFDSSYIDKNEKYYKAKVTKIPLTYDMINISSNPSIPVSLENIIFRCIACKPEDKKYRYNSIEEIIRDVEKCIPYINKDDPAVLLKPVDQRIYQRGKVIKIDKIRSSQKWYKQWWFFALVVLTSLAILIVCIVMFFIF